MSTVATVNPTVNNDSGNKATGVGNNNIIKGPSKFTFESNKANNNSTPVTNSGNNNSSNGITKINSVSSRISQWQTQSSPANTNNNITNNTVNTPDNKSKNTTIPQSGPVTNGTGGSSIETSAHGSNVSSNSPNSGKGSNTSALLAKFGGAVKPSYQSKTLGPAPKLTNPSPTTTTASNTSTTNNTGASGNINNLANKSNSLNNSNSTPSPAPSTSHHHNNSVPSISTKQTFSNTSNNINSTNNSTNNNTTSLAKTGPILTSTTSASVSSPSNTPSSNATPSHASRSNNKKNHNRNSSQMSEAEHNELVAMYSQVNDTNPSVPHSSPLPPNNNSMNSVISSVTPLSRPGKHGSVVKSAGRSHRSDSIPEYTEAEAAEVIPQSSIDNAFNNLSKFDRRNDSYSQSSNQGIDYFPTTTNETLDENTIRNPNSGNHTRSQTQTQYNREDGNNSLVAGFNSNNTLTGKINSIVIPQRHITTNSISLVTPNGSTLSRASSGGESPESNESGSEAFESISSPSGSVHENKGPVQIHRIKKSNEFKMKFATLPNPKKAPIESLYLQNIEQNKLGNINNNLPLVVHVTQALSSTVNAALQPQANNNSAINKPLIIHGSLNNTAMKSVNSLTNTTQTAARSNNTTQPTNSTNTNTIANINTSTASTTTAAVTDNSKPNNKIGVVIDTARTHSTTEEDVSSNTTTETYSQSVTRTATPKQINTQPASVNNSFSNNQKNLINTTEDTDNTDDTDDTNDTPKANTNIANNNNKSLNNTLSLDSNSSSKGLPMSLSFQIERKENLAPVHERTSSESIPLPLDANNKNNNTGNNKTANKVPNNSGNSRENSTNSNSSNNNLNAGKQKWYQRFSFFGNKKTETNEKNINNTTAHNPNTLSISSAGSATSSANPSPMASHTSQTGTGSDSRKNSEKKQSTFQFNSTNTIPNTSNNTSTNNGTNSNTSTMNSTNVLSPTYDSVLSNSGTTNTATQSITVSLNGSSQTQSTNNTSGVSSKTNPSSTPSFQRSLSPTTIETLLEAPDAKQAQLTNTAANQIDSNSLLSFSNISFSCIQPLKGGILFKRAQSRNRWQKHLFLLAVDHHLYYFAETRDLSPLGVLNVKHCIVKEERSIGAEQSNSKRRRYCFSVLCSRGYNLHKKSEYRDRRYYFVCDTVADMSDWIYVLKTSSNWVNNPRDMETYEQNNNNIDLITKPSVTRSIRTNSNAYGGKRMSSATPISITIINTRGQASTNTIIANSDNLTKAQSD